MQAQLAALNQRKDHGEISEAQYEQLRAELLQAR
ncbi:SHOCT domain-containing protein [Mycobacterium tuberculosis]